MKRKINLDLPLDPIFYQRQRQEQTMRSIDQEYFYASGSHDSNEQKQLTIFYNGNVYVYDVTHFQAKAIMKIAQDTEDKMIMKTPTETLTPVSIFTASHTTQVCSSPPAVAQSMKKSLHSFLQKRKHRINSS